MQELHITINNITYYSPETGYHVVKAKCQELNNSLITVIGVTQKLEKNTNFKITGSWQTHSKYGQQFKAETWEEVMPATIKGIKSYLASGLIKGIGPKTAELIVSHFGKETLTIIDNNIEKLSEITGIGKKKINMIKKSWAEHNEIKDIMIFLQGYGISPTYAIKIFKEYGKESVQRIKENPYCIADDIWGIGFLKADEIARKMNISVNHPNRFSACILYILKTMSSEGHVFAYSQELVNKVMEILSHNVTETIDINILRNVYASMKDAKKIIPENYYNETAIYLPWLYKAEKNTADKLNSLQKNQTAANRTIIKPDIEKIERKLGIQYDEVQKEAIRTAVNNQIMILTGGPGTGKTTVTKGIIEAFLELDKEILLAAPTGKAAKRMSETCSMEAKTIHRLLEYGQEGFGRNEENLLEGDVLIIDESSMLDISLTYNLLKAVPDNMTVIFVGDIDQLPSVGPGNVLKDLIESGQYPVTRLTQIFRQAQESDIVINAHKINHGYTPDLSSKKDFIFIEEENEEKIAEYIASICRRLQNRNIETQVLTPMKKRTIGSEQLNILLQKTLNNSYETGVRYGSFTYKPGDKIIQTKNNYDKDVYNGDTGFIKEIDDDSVYISFDNKIIEYSRSELDQINPAYAITIHKSQGSQFPVVIIPLTMTFYIMLQRNLLYTGLTRAKQKFILIGTTRALNYAIKNTKITQRNTLLSERIKSLSTHHLR